MKTKQTLNNSNIFQQSYFIHLHIARAIADSLRSINYRLFVYWTILFLISTLLGYVKTNDILITLILYLSCPVSLFLVLYLIIFRTWIHDIISHYMHVLHCNKTYFLSKWLFTLFLVSAISIFLVKLLNLLDIEFINDYILPHSFTSPFLILLKLNLVDNVVFMNTSGNSAHPGNADIGGNTEPSGGAPEPPKSPNSSGTESNPDSKKKVDKGKGRAILVESDESVEEPSKKKRKFSSREERDESEWPEWILNPELDSEKKDSSPMRLKSSTEPVPNVASPTFSDSDDSISVLDTPSPIHDYDSDNTLNKKLEYAHERKKLDDLVRESQKPPLPAKTVAGPSKPRSRNV